jgi:TonB family protein
LNAYFSVDDYPVRAEREEQQGAVHFRLAIAPDGRIAECIVTRSSGSATLDRATCRALSARVRYAPLRRLGGSRTATSDQGIVRWRLAPGGPRRPRWHPPEPIMETWTVHEAPGEEIAAPPAPAAPPGAGVAVRAVPHANLTVYFRSTDYPGDALQQNRQGDVRFALDIGVNGRVTDCRITVSSGTPSLDSATCRIIRSRARFTPARDAAGNPVPDTIASHIGWWLDGQRH